MTRFSPTRILHLSKLGSHHVVLSINLESYNHSFPKRKLRLFRFEESWAKEQRCEGLVHQFWRGSLGSCKGKIEGLKALQGEFEDNDLGKIRKELTILEKTLKDSPPWGSDEKTIQRFKCLESRQAELLKLQETMWRQRSRAMWLRDGDKNTKFFHGKASQRRKVNHISKLKDSNGVWWRGDEKVEELLIQ